MGMFKEFKEFAIRGNVVDLAVAVVLGGAFGAIILSFVDDILTPLLLSPALEAAGVKDIKELVWGNGVKYGKFLSTIISFIFIAFAMFLLVKAANKIQKSPTAAPSSTDALLMEIRDSLKK